MRRVELSTGVTLNVAFDGPENAPAVILLHGFPESHRTWREIAPRLRNRFRLVMPDQRGFGASDKPGGVDSYRPARLADDVLALADALAVDRFALVGHDWGGAVAWALAIRGEPRLSRLAIVNSPHPLVFQKSLFDDPQQRLASQYITAFRSEGFEAAVEAQGFEWFFDKSFAPHVDPEAISPEERARYIADWSRPGAFEAMLNWYRASPILVPAPGEETPPPDWLADNFPYVRVPTLVIWGMRDRALLPVQLEGLSDLVEDLHIVRLPGAGHFAPWEAPDEVADALAPFLAGDTVATGAGQ